jgi:hypothetical protein
MYSLVPWAEFAFRNNYPVTRPILNASPWQVPYGLTIESYWIGKPHPNPANRFFLLSNNVFFNVPRHCWLFRDALDTLEKDQNLYGRFFNDFGPYFLTIRAVNGHINPLQIRPFATFAVRTDGPHPLITNGTTSKLVNNYLTSQTDVISLSHLDFDKVGGGGIGCVAVRFFGHCATIIDALFHESLPLPQFPGRHDLRLNWSPRVVLHLQAAQHHRVRPVPCAVPGAAAQVILFQCLVARDWLLVDVTVRWPRSSQSRSQLQCVFAGLRWYKFILSTMSDHADTSSAAHPRPRAAPGAIARSATEGTLLQVLPKLPQPPSVKTRLYFHHTHKQASYAELLW